MEQNKIETNLTRNSCYVVLIVSKLEKILNPLVLKLVY